MSKGRIVFFDATEVRREKMRNAAMGVKAPKTASQNVEFVDKNVTPPIVEPKTVTEPEKKAYNQDNDNDVLPFVEKAEAKQAAPAAPAPAVNVSKEELEGALIAFVVEQTGYPDEMVEMDADLEGDLGIDSIKKAQLMGELNEKYHFVDVSAPADNDLSLDDFPTLASIRDYLLGKAGEAGTAPVEKQEVTTEPEPAPAPEPEPAPTPAPAPKSTGAAPTVSVSKEELESALVAFVVEQTGYPEDMVEMDADLEGDLGIDSIKKAQLMGELNEKYHFVDVSAPADSDLSLDDFPTLASIRDYLLGKAGESGTAPVEKQEVTTAPEPEPAPEPAPVPEPTPAPAPKSTGSAPSVSKEELEAALVSFVVEQTGYPEDMVEMDADLEGDLGIDSIKKAQLMGELNEKYHFVDVSAPADSDLSLDDFPTLASIRDYLLGKAGEAGTAPVEKQEVTTAPEPEPAPAPAPAPEPAPEPAPAPSTKTSVQSPNFKEELAAFLINFVVEQTGYPEEMVEMDIDLEAELGIDSIKKAQLFGELSEKYELVPLGDMSLEDFKTLRDIYNAILQCAR